MSTCNRLDLETLGGYWPVYAQKSSSNLKEKKPGLNDTCEEEEEEEGDTPHINTWRIARLWVDFFDGLHLMTKFMIYGREVWQ